MEGTPFLLLVIPVVAGLLANHAILPPMIIPGIPGTAGMPTLKGRRNKLIPGHVPRGEYYLARRFLMYSRW